MSVSSVPPSPKTNFWRDRGVRGVIYQVVVVALVVFSGWYLWSNAVHNLQSQGISTGYGYLDRESGFEIAESLIAYSAASDYGTALWVGILNTVHVAALGIVFATVLGVAVGIGTLSKNWLVRKVAYVFIEVPRNIPVLLQLFLWFTILIQILPNPRNALDLGAGFYLLNRGFYFPVPIDAPGWDAALVGLGLGLVGAYILGRWARARQDKTGRQFPAFKVGLAMIVGLPILLWAAFGAPLDFSIPELRGFNFQGGARVSPPFMAVLFGLTVYTSTYIAEVVRAGILAVPHGQTEAAESVGLKPNVTMRKVILPQALRVIVPPTTNQYLNLTKNSSLAVAVGYPDLVSVTNTTLNQTGQAVEAISVMMLIYLGLSILTSLFMNWYNKRIQLVER